MKRVWLYIFFLLIPSVLTAQSVRDTILTGTVTSRSAENIFIGFESTNGINKGDTLFVKKRGRLVPAVEVMFVSSKSVSGKVIGNVKVKTAYEVYAKVKIITKEEKYPVETAVLFIPPEDSVVKTTTQPNKRRTVTIEPYVKGRIGVQSYSSFANYGKAADYQRWRYTFKLDAYRIGGSNFSYTQYINFAYRSSEWSDVSRSIGNALRIYDLAVKYDFSNSTNVWLGRHLNRRISNMGTIDGLQFETGFSAFTAGLVVGSRPNFSDMGLNTKLFEYGAYISRFDSIGYSGMTNTLAYFEQTNDFKTDRRFLYFQHSNSAIPNTRLFLSTEIDMFKKINGVTKSDFSLTSLFISANIRASSALSFFISYDARKNVIYYETFKDFIDSVFENETRQGFRARVNIRPVRNVYLGLNYGYRFRPGDLKPSNNYGGFLTYSMIPGLRAGITVSYRRLTGSYVNGSLWGIRMYKDFGTDFGASVNYRNTKYDFTQNISGITQRSVSIDVNTRIFNPLYVSIAYEGVFQSTQTWSRVLFNITYRF